MKIIKLQADNFKRLKAVEITPKGNVVEITGKNANGKSSVLDAIWAALGGATHIQAEPIRKGATKARIRLDMGDIIVTRSFTKAGTQLTVENAEGLGYKAPQKMLDDLVGALAFDPLEFTRMKPRGQYDELRKLAHVDADIDNLDALNAKDYASKTDVNREVKQIRAQMEALVIPADPGPVESVTALLQEMENLEEMRADEESNTRAYNALVSAIQTKTAEFQRMRNDLIAMKDTITAMEGELQAMAVPAEPEDVTNRITEIKGLIQAQSGKALLKSQYDAALQSRADLASKADQKEALALSLSETIEARNQTKQDAISRAQMPIPNLGFGDGIVLYQGVPFEQASSAEQLKVSTAIAMAANPKLRVIRITDGSLLDEDSMAMLHQMAVDNDFQVWVEVVDSSQKIGIVISDGEVVADNQEEPKVPVGECPVTSPFNDDLGPPMSMEDVRKAHETGGEESLPWNIRNAQRTDTSATKPLLRPNSDEKLDRRHAQGLDLEIP